MAAHAKGRDCEQQAGRRQQEQGARAPYCRALPACLPWPGVIRRHPACTAGNAHAKQLCHGGTIAMRLGMVHEKSGPACGMKKMLGLRQALCYS